MERSRKIEQKRREKNVTSDLASNLGRIEVGKREVGMEQAANNKAPIDNGVIRPVDLRNEEYDRYDPITSDLGKKI